MIHDLPFLGRRAAKAEPRHHPWPPTWRLPSGAIRVEASFKEPWRQKLIEKATKAVTFITLASIIIGHEQWPWPEMVVLVRKFTAGSGSLPLTELAAAWLFVALIGVGTIVGTFRLTLVAIGIDQGRITIEFHRNHLLVDGRTFDRSFIQGFELEPHQLGKIEAHNEKRLGQITNLYYRETYTVVLQYAERRIGIAHVFGREQAGALLGRLQDLKKRPFETSANHRSGVAEPRL